MATAFDSTLAGLGIPTTTAAAKAAAAPSAAGTKTTLGQADFLKLLTAQMSNQDPFNPVDNTQMIAQMAQFSSVAGISQMNTTLNAIATKLGVTSSGEAMNYVGKTVLTEGKTAYARGGGGLAGAVELDAAATDVTVTIADKTGATLRTLALGAQPPGTISYDWDGKTDAGQPAGDGPYTVTASAADAGTAVTSRNLVWAPVQSVSLPPGGAPSLNVAGLGAIAVSAVRQVG